MIPQVETISLIEGLASRADSGGYSFEAEHRAEHVDSLEDAINCFTSIGWAIVLQKPDVAFLSKNKQVLELVTGEIPEHLAFRVTEIEHIDRIESTIRIFDPAEKRVEIVKTDNVPGEIRHIMIKCVGTEQHIQFIWRAKSLV